VLPTACATLPGLLASTETVGLERYLHQRTRGVATLVLALVWLVLAWRHSGRPEHVAALEEPLLTALLGRRLPSATSLRRSLHRVSARAIRQATEAANLAELPRPPDRVWVAVDAHQIPYWGRGQRRRFRKGWAGGRSRSLRGYRLSVAVDCATGQVITFALVRGHGRDHRLLAPFARRRWALLGRRLAGIVADCGFTTRASVAALQATGVPFILGFAHSAPIRRRLQVLSPQQRRWLRDGEAVRLGACPWDPRLRLFALAARTTTDRRGPWVEVTSLRSAGPRQLAARYRQRARVEQALADLLHGHDLDHLVSTRLHPNQVALGFRLLAHNLALGYQLAAAPRPPRLLEPLAFRYRHVDGLGIVWAAQRTIYVRPLHPTQPCT
jgi:hypothetical protein